MLSARCTLTQLPDDELGFKQRLGLKLTTLDNHPISAKQLAEATDDDIAQLVRLCNVSIRGTGVRVAKLQIFLSNGALNSVTSCTPECDEWGPEDIKLLMKEAYRAGVEEHKMPSFTSALLVFLCF